jgi:CRP-like cAMP-binding protein
MAKYSFKEKERMAKAALKAKLNSIIQTDEVSMQACLNAFHLDTFKKNSILVKQGDHIEHIYFIIKGVIKIYFYKKDKMIIERFENEGGFFGGNYDHLSKYQKVHNIEALEDLVVLKIKQNDLYNLFKEYHAIESLYRTVLEAFHYSYVDRLYALKAATSEERYLDFEQEYGDIINRISLRNIVSYLDMTSETISRIRAKLSKQSKQ